jgi:DNA-binding transcriptional regulator YdaS (Cro superfamily)
LKKSFDNNQAKRYMFSMNLSEHLEKTYQALSPADRYREFARLVDSHPFYIYQLATGRRKASLALSGKISRATCGQVSITDMRPDLSEIFKQDELESQGADPPSPAGLL